METKNKKNNQTWIKAKSLPIGRGIKQKSLVAIVFKTPPPKIPQTWKQKDQKPPKRKEISWQPAKIKESVRKMITKYMNIQSFMYLL